MKAVYALAPCLKTKREVGQVAGVIRQAGVECKVDILRTIPNIFPHCKVTLMVVLFNKVVNIVNYKRDGEGDVNLKGIWKFHPNPAAIPKGEAQHGSGSIALDFEKSKALVAYVTHHLDQIAGVVAVVDEVRGLTTILPLLESLPVELPKVMVCVLGGGHAEKENITSIIYDNYFRRDVVRLCYTKQERDEKLPAKNCIINRAAYCMIGMTKFSSGLPHQNNDDTSPTSASSGNASENPSGTKQTQLIEQKPSWQKPLKYKPGPTWGPRDTVLPKLLEIVKKRKPIMGAGAGTGISAKFEAAGGADMIIVYNSGKYFLSFLIVTSNLF